MARRSRAREVVLQVLYQDDLNPAADPRVVDEFLRARLKGEDLVDFARSLWQGVRRNRDELDVLLKGAAANWSLERMAVTDRNLLRIATFEMLYTDTPGRVAIDEAVELAKRYGAEHSSQFVNGVLDKLMHDRDAAGS
jgi:N utilization substance protein B